MSRANDALAAEQYDTAEKEFRDVLRLAPADPVALRQLGILYHDQGELPQAYSLLKQAAELRPDDTEAQLKLGLIYFRTREYQKAHDAAVRVLEKQPANEEALILLADTVASLEDLEETQKLIETLREKNQDHAGYHLAQGLLNLRQRDQAGAEREFKAALELEPTSNGALTALGGLYWSRNDLKAAAQAFKTAADLNSRRSPMWLIYADFLLKTGAVAEAKGILEDINGKIPAYLPPRVYLMKIACAEHQDENCVARVQNVLAQDPVNYEALFQSGTISLTKGEATQAIRAFEQAINIHGDNAQVRFRLGLAYLLNMKSFDAVNNRKALDDADNSLNIAIKLDPHFDRAILLSAEIKIRKGNPAAAVEPLVQLIKEQPKIAQAHYLLASAYLAQQNERQALAVYRRMTDLFPQDAQPYFFIGTLLLTQRQLPDARKAFEKAVEISPDHLPALEKLADIDIAEQHYDAALDRLQPQIEKNPKAAQLWFVRAKIYWAQRDFTRAEADLQKAIDSDTKLEAAYILLAQVYISTNRHEQAIQELTAFAEKNKTVPTLMLLAAIYEQQKNFSAARDAYEKLLTVDPNFAAALNNLAVLYSEYLGQVDKAYDFAKKAKEAAPNDPRLTDTLGWILFKKRDYVEALRLLQETASKVPDNPEIQFHIGMAYSMVGDEGLARVALQKAADARADFLGKDEARQRLALMAIDVMAANPGVRTDLENFLRQWPNDPAALVRLAELQKREGAVDQAVKTYEKLIADHPYFAPATRQLALLYAQRPADFSKAYGLALKARQAYPNDPEVAKTLGILSYQREFFPRSAELLKEAAAKRSDDAELFAYLGRAYGKLKQWNECKVALEHALTLNLSPALANEARLALAECSDPAPQ